MTNLVKIKTKALPSSYEIRIGGGLLSACGEWAAASLSYPPGRVAIISNKKVYGLYGEAVSASLTATGFTPFVHLIGDGERFKNLRTLETALGFLSESRIARTDCVLALGGGVVGDLAGFAASVYLRGVEFLQVPTTLLAMIDSSVGGKTGVNSAFGKNLVGAFYQPRGVLADFATLGTLPKREMTAGFCEAVKQGAIGGRRLFDQTANFLAKMPELSLRSGNNDPKLAIELSALLAKQVLFKASVVAGDEREDAGNMNERSRKILNFGHTFGHALEKVTNYRYLRHGEAVGHGILFASALSKNLGLLGQDEVNLLYDVVHRTGKLPSISHIDPREAFATFKYDKKMLNSSLHWVLLRSVGEPVIFPHSQIPAPALTSAFKEAIRK